jgi:hypothetical protein
MRERCEYKLTLTVVSPFLFESIINARLGVDCAQMRNEAGRPIIPAAQVKGVVRDALETLASRTKLITESDIDTLFGKSSLRGADDSNEPSRGTAIFSDLIAADAPEKPEGHTTRIEIDDETGAVKTGALQVIELSSRFGTEVAFSGSLIVCYPPGLDRNKCENALAKALKLIPAIGALKSAGFGAVKEGGSALECLGTRPLALPAAVSGERITYRVAFDRPLLVDSRYIAENVFESAKIVPGAAFKGPLANRLKLAGVEPESDPDWSRALAQLRISHAFPLVEGRAAEYPIPASIVFSQEADGIEYADAIAGEFGRAPLWSGDVAQFVAPAKKDIQKDWRGRAEMPEWRADLLPRTHIAINEKGDASGQRRIAFDERLYTSAESMLYVTVMLPTRGHEWLLTVDAGRLEDKVRAAQLIAMLEEGLYGVGKTDARPHLTRIDRPAEPDVPAPGTVDLMLKTPAVLFDPLQQPHDLDSSMAHRYAAYFNEKLGAALQNVFARQSMAGGYLAMRRRPYHAYYPFVLTEAGAVFRLNVPDAACQQKLADALRFGLPVPDLGGKPASWHICPFMPENGYGEVVLHKPPGLRDGALTFIDEARE